MCVHFYPLTSSCKIALTGLKVTEVAHDIQMQVARYLQDMGFVNSYDTWHGKELQEIVPSHTVKKRE